MTDPKKAWSERMLREFEREKSEWAEVRRLNRRDTAICFALMAVWAACAVGALAVLLFR